ncbi:MAG: TetR-like C-terminal domain-containing protein [Christensenellales bacterium]
MICSNVWRKTFFEQLNEVILAHRGEPVLAHIRPMLTDVFHIVAENKEICRVLLSDNGDIKFLQRLSDVIQEKLRTEWLNGYVDNETEFEYRYAFGALGFVGLLRTWLHRDCAESAESMAVLADSLIRQGIMNGIPNLK